MNKHFQQPVTDATQCAGQNCQERKQCRRYRRRDPKAQWATFDLERSVNPGPCLHKLVVKFDKKAA